MKSSERYRIKSFTNPSGTEVFRVIGRTPKGEQIRRNFRDMREAIGFKAELEIAALNATQAVTLKRTRLSDDQLAQAEAAIQKLEGTSHTLIQAVDFLLRNWQPSAVAKTVKDAATEFIVDKQGQKLRPRSVNDLRIRVNKIVKGHDQRLVSEIGIEEIRRIVAVPGHAARTQNGDRRALHTFFAWCVKRNYCAANPVQKIDPAKVEDTEPAILALPSVKALLSAAMAYRGGLLVPYFCLSLFAGLRPAELERIDWKDINLAGRLIVIKGEAAKLRKRRHVEMSENLIAWLLPYQTHPIVGQNWRRDFDAVRRMAGFAGRKSEAPDGEKLQEWPDDVLRHTALSNHLAYHKHEGAAAAWAGNSPEIVQKHYKGLVTPTDAAAYWSLTPENVSAPVVPFPAAA
jgi:integrase